jgi:hypothetical protein
LKPLRTPRVVKDKGDITARFKKKLSKKKIKAQESKRDLEIER